MNGEGNTYENVVMELLDGNSCLFVQTFGELINETKTYIAEENTTKEIGFYKIQDKTWRMKPM